ncbi:UNVERIFIED_CONTAM: hypothetical protein FKN15_027575 [Acipenser sinensis]
MHHYQVKEKILRLYREQGTLQFQGARIYIFPDFSPELNRKRAAYGEVKSLLYNAGTIFGLLHPPWLRFMFNGTEKMFNSPDEAKEFYTKTILLQLNVSFSSTFVESTAFLFIILYCDRDG